MSTKIQIFVYIYNIKRDKIIKHEMGNLIAFYPGEIGALKFMVKNRQSYW